MQQIDRPVGRNSFLCPDLNNGSNPLLFGCRLVRLVGLDAKQKADIGPLKSEIRGLEWASDGYLYIQLSRDILVASADGKTVRTVQEIQEEDGIIVAMSISPSASHLAASIHSPSDNQVLVLAATQASHAFSRYAMTAP